MGGGGGGGERKGRKMNIKVQVGASVGRTTTTRRLY